MAAMCGDAAATARRLFEDGGQQPLESGVLETLVRFGSDALAFALDARIRVRLLRGAQKYRDASPALARSGIDPRVRANFTNARAFVTPYAATGIDEYFAESLRAFVGVNDPVSPWPKA